MKDKVVLVTGGSGGLGAGVLAVFAEVGARIVVADRKPPAAPPPGARYHATDLLDEEAMRAMIERTLTEDGRIDALVNLVGGFVAGKLVESSLDDLDHMYRLNVRPVFAACRYALPAMIARGSGKIVNVGARPAVTAVAGLAAYAAMKAAVVQLTEALAAECTAKNVQVNAILPSIIDTPANRAAMPAADPSKWVRPESLGRVIRFLCSTEAADVAGAVLPVYGKS